MKFLLMIVIGVSVISIFLPNAFGCSRDLSYLFWSPIIDRVSGDCSFAGYDINPSGLLFTGVMGFAVAVFVIRMKRK